MGTETDYTTYFLLTIFLALCTCILWFYKTSFDYWKKRNLYYIKPTIPFGTVAKVVFGKYTFGEMIAKYYLQMKKEGIKQGGGFVLWKPIYIPVDPDIIKKILITDFENFPNHGFYISQNGDPLSTHIFNMEDARWRSLRAKLPAAFTTAKMRKMFLIMERMSVEFKNVLDRYAEEGTPINIKEVTTRFTTDIFSACGFGTETNTMKNENAELLKHGRSFFDNQWHLYRNTAVVALPRKFLQMCKFRIFKKETENYMKNMFKSIKDYRQEKNVVRGDIAEILIRLTEKHEDEYDITGKKPMEPLNFDEFMAQMFVFFSAGFETSSSTQTFAIYELARNPKCLTKLREEINTVLEKHNNKITYDAIMEMKYLDNVVDEALRMYPVFPIIPRIAGKDYKVPGTDFTIEKDTFVFVSNMGIQRDPDYYPNPDQFDPDQFSTENKSKRPFVAHLPFGEGQRICIGKRFGLLQTKIGLITLVRNYEIALNGKTLPKFSFESRELILRKKGDVWIDLKKISTN